MRPHPPPLQWPTQGMRLYQPLQWPTERMRRYLPSHWRTSRRKWCHLLQLGAIPTRQEDVRSMRTIATEFQEPCPSLCDPDCDWAQLGTRMWLLCALLQYHKWAKEWNHAGRNDLSTEIVSMVQMKENRYRFNSALASICLSVASSVNGRCQSRVQAMVKTVTTEKGIFWSRLYRYWQSAQLIISVPELNVNEAK